MIYIYGRAGCQPCQSVKNYCESNNLTYEYYDVLAQPEYRTEVETKLGHPISSVPHVFIDNKYIGNADDFLQHMRK